MGTLSNLNTMFGSRFIQHVDRRSVAIYRWPY